MTSADAYAAAPARGSAARNEPPDVAVPSCLDAKSQPHHDRWRGFGRVTIGTATREMPQMVEFETDGVADVALDRPIAYSTGSVRFDIDEAPAAPGRGERARRDGLHSTALYKSESPRGSEVITAGE
jgi:hypothetical protein